MANQHGDGPIQQYQYLPLNESKHETRIFTLDMESLNTDTLCLSMSCVSLDEHPRYYAISYACGDTSDKVPVRVGHCILPIHRSLDVALRNMARATAPRVLWADAICINQADNDEKSYQVAQMDRVYRQAQSVMVWLGLASYELSVACMSLTLLSTEGCLQRGTMSDQEYNQFVEHMLPLLELMAPPGTEDDTTSSVRQKLGLRLPTVVLELVRPVFALPWWERVWTVQEYVLSQHADFFVGPAIMPSSIVSSAVEYMVEITNQVDRLAVSTSLLNFTRDELVTFVKSYEKILISLRFCKERARSLTIGSCLRNAPHLLTLREVMMHTLGSQMRYQWPQFTFPMKSTDPRDQVFAVISMTADRQQLDIRPNYSRPCEQVYMDTTRALVRAGDVSILSFAESKEKVSSIPSWCVDWSHHIFHSLLRINYKHRDDWNYSATLNSQVESKVCDMNPNILSISGVIFDRVKDIAQNSFPTGQDTYGTELDSWLEESLNGRRDAKTFLLRLLDLLLLLKHNDTISQSMLEACAVTPTAGKMIDRDNLCWEKADSELCVAAFQTTMRLLLANQPPTWDDSPSGVAAWQRYHLAIQFSASGKRLFVTESDRIGLGPPDIQPEDEVVLLLGASIPYIIRQESESSKGGRVIRHHKLIGETYVHGVMEGEYMATKPEESVIHLI